jgi:hypothetical protein
MDLQMHSLPMSSLSPIYSQIDDEGHTFQPMDEIIDHSADKTAVREIKG